ncbi:hypothetical protein QUB29_26395 [Microcoleus sp. B4b_D2]|uniref:hypothetical protein n=1 Tax=Microcoleus sp. B4b_D2 TaxID=3055310 RepID=UPI002FD798E3
MDNTVSTNRGKFVAAVSKVLSGKYTETAGKTQLTKIVNQWKKEDTPDAIKTSIEKFLLTIDLPKEATWITKRYHYVPGSFWLENSSSKYGDTVLGWHDDILQIQAEELPLKLHYRRFEDDRYIEVLDWLGWEKKGFAAAEDLPLCCLTNQVEIPIEKTWAFAKLKYAAPCPLQWERKYNRSLEDKGLYVVRSIIPYGFWQAWKWWPEAREWYYNHRPELFEDDEIWGEKLSWHEPPNSYSAILSPNNSKLVKSQIFRIEE